MIKRLLERPSGLEKENKVMPSFTLEEIKKITEGKVLKGDMKHCFKDISIDSRKIERGDLFIAIKGDNFDGHDFVCEALNRGADGAIISKRELWDGEALSDKKSGLMPCIILVKDTLDALQKISEYHRDKVSITFIGITGSNGKTTSKEMIASVLGTRLSVLKNEGNYNNHIGVPLTLLRLKPSHDIGVVEMGMSGLGEIRRLCEIAKPSIGVLTNISGVHLEFLGSVERVKEAKGELVDFIDQKGTVILNADDPNVMDLKKRVKGRVLTYGIGSDADMKAKNIRDLGVDGVAFLLIVEDREIEVSLPLIGRYNISNALAAAAVGAVCNIGIEDIKRGLESFRGIPMRMELCSLDDIKIINDSYNANPSSMERAVETLSHLNKKGRSFMVVGDMLELGDSAEDAHRKIGKLIAGKSIDFLIAVGEMAAFIGEEALKNKMREKNVFLCKTVDEAVERIDKELKSGDIVLVKGSRSTRMDRVIEKLRKTRKVH